MPTPPKPVNVIRLEGKSHRTKKELIQRKKAEDALLTGISIKESKEVGGSPSAHREFLRLRKLLESIGKNDDLYGSTINRYCLLTAECEEFQQRAETAGRQLEELIDHHEDMELAEYIRLITDLQKSIAGFDRQLQAKRKMLFDIEKENIMTIASSLRSIPKKADKKKNPLMDALNG